MSAANCIESAEALRKLARHLESVSVAARSHGGHGWTYDEEVQMLRFCSEVMESSPDTAVPSSCVSAATWLQAFAAMSPAARAYHDEYWEWLWHGEDSDRLIGDKKAELRAKHGDMAERELFAALRANGFLPSEKPVA